MLVSRRPSGIMAAAAAARSDDDDVVAKLDRWDDGSVAAIAGALVRSIQKQDALTAAYKATISPQDKETRALKARLLDALLGTGTRCAALAPPSPDDRLTFVRLIERHCLAAALTPKLVADVLSSLTLASFAAAAHDVETERAEAAAEARRRAAAPKKPKRRTAAVKFVSKRAKTEAMAAAAQSMTSLDDAGSVLQAASAAHSVVSLVTAPADEKDGEDGEGDRPLTAAEMFVEVIMRHIRRAHRPLKADVVVTTAAPKGVDRASIPEAPDVIAGPARAWQTSKQALAERKVAFARQRAVVRRVIAECHERIKGRLDAASEFRSLVVEGPDGDMERSVSLRLKVRERHKRRIGLGDLQGMVAAAGVVPPDIANEPFDALRHTRVLLEKPAMALLGKIVGDMAAFVRDNSEQVTVVQFRRSPLRPRGTSVADEEEAEEEEEGGAAEEDTDDD